VNKAAGRTQEAVLVKVDDGGPPDRLLWAFIFISVAMHVLILFAGPHPSPSPPLQIIELELAAPAERNTSNEPPPKGIAMKAPPVARRLELPDVQPVEPDLPEPPRQPPEPVCKPETSKPVTIPEVRPQPKPAPKPKAVPKPKPVPKSRVAIAEPAASAAERPPADPAAPAQPAAGAPDSPRPPGDPTSNRAGVPDSLKPAGNPTSNEDGIRSFLAQVRRRIDQSKQYPFAARRRHMEGRVTVRFAIRPDGSVDQLEVAKSSKIPLLDKAALEAVRQAAPFPEFPKEQLRHSLVVEIGIVFELS
jgi:protein TonB